MEEKVVPSVEEIRSWLKPLSKEVIDSFEEGAHSQADFVLGLYRYAFGSLWDNITSLDGYPSVSSKTWLYVCECAIRVDKRFHPEVLAGGLWMNRGFSTDDSIEEWAVGFGSVREIEFGKE
jgi:hypothetical protein